MATEYVRVGADPEVFVKHLASKQVLPVCGLVGGTKDKPLPMAGLAPRATESGIYAFQEDGCAYEFNVPAATSADRFAGNMQIAWGWVKTHLSTLGLDPQIRPEYSFKSSLLTVPQANAIGCSPDMSAYGDNGPEMRKPLNIQDFGTSRFCGGHLHLGYNKKVPPYVIARFLDVVIGLPSLLRDKQGARRSYYGLPGLFREKPYGMEYRSLSNYWLKCIAKPDYLTFLSGAVFDLGLVAEKNPHVLATAYKMLPWADVREAITTENVELAREIFLYAQNVAKVPTRYAGELWRFGMPSEK